MAGVTLLADDYILVLSYFSCVAALSLGGVPMVNDVCLCVSQLYRRLSEVLGLNDETMVLSVFIGKM